MKLLNAGGGGGGNAVFKADFDFSKLGIGGLDDEFNDIFRRAFASRVFPASMVKKLGITHVRGMLLYGPPGNIVFKTVTPAMERERVWK